MQRLQLSKAARHLTSMALQQQLQQQTKAAAAA
jgi:hypothetical protein